MSALTRRISEFSTARGGGRVNNNNKGGRQGRGRNPGCSKTAEESQNLSPEERAKVYRARENQQQNKITVVAWAVEVVEDVIMRDVVAAEADIKMNTITVQLLPAAGFSAALLNFYE